MTCLNGIQAIRIYPSPWDEVQLRVTNMPKSYIICAELDVDDRVVVGLYASDWFECGVNANSDLYPSADAALIAARSAYKGPDIVGLGCRVWAEPANA